MARKRANGEGSLRRSGNNTWHGEIMCGYTPTGKRNMIRFSARAKSDVLHKMREFQTERENHLHPDRNLTLSEWADVWYKDYQTQVQPSTYSGYKYTLALIKARLGEQKLRDILPIHINQLQNDLIADGYSMSQIRKCRAMLIQILDAAEYNDLIPRNPARKAKIVRDLDGSLTEARREKDAFTEEEIQMLREHLEPGLMGASILLMLDTGLRVQELLALAPNDIAEDGSTIDVNKAIKTVDGHPTLGVPKSKKSIRLIPVPECSRAYAKYLRENGGSELIWSLPGRNPYYSIGTFRRRYYTALKQVDGVRLLSPHCCRHTYVTRLQSKGVPIDLIARLAGHSSIATTDIYMHTSLHTLENAVAALNG